MNTISPGGRWRQEIDVEAAIARHTPQDARRRLPAPHQSPADYSSPPEESFPQRLTVEFADDHTNPQKPQTTMYLRHVAPNAFPDGPIEDYLGTGHRQGYQHGLLGRMLTDESYDPDGYRFHHALHLTLMTQTGYSPVMRSLLGVRRHSQKHARVEDSPRAALLEETMFNGLAMQMDPITGAILPRDSLTRFSRNSYNDFAKVLPEGTGISSKTWNNIAAIGTRLLVLLVNSIGHPEFSEESHRSAWAHFNLNEKSVHFSLEGPEQAKTAPRIHPRTRLSITRGIAKYGLRGVPSAQWQ